MADLGIVTSQLEQYLQAERVETPQQRFDVTYITTNEIMERVPVSRPSIIRKMNLRFPSIKIGNTYFWERSAEVDSYIEAWATLRLKG